DRAANTVRDIFHRNENVQLEIRRLYLFCLGLRIETFLHVIFLRARYLLKLSQSNVVIRYDKAIRAHERTRPAIVESNAREAKVIAAAMKTGSQVNLYEVSRS